MPKRKVGLIVGHRPSAKGAKNRASGISEYDFWDKFVTVLSDMLKERGKVEPVVIHREDSKVGYNRLPYLANAEKCDFLVSFHSNAFNTKATGSEVLFCSKKGKALAQELQDAQLNALGLVDRGLKYTDEEGRGGHLLWNTKPPCVIVEPFFIDNNSDLQTAQTRKEGLYQGYARAIESFAQWGVRA